MKKMLVVTLTICALSLSGCGANADDAVAISLETTVAPSAKRTTVAKRTTAATAETKTRKPVIVPEVAGRNYSEVNGQLRIFGYTVRLTGSDGKEIFGEVPGNVIVERANIAAGTAVEVGTVLVLTLRIKQSELAAAVTAAAQAEVLATRYDYSCTTSGSSLMDDTSDFKSSSEVWASQEFADIDSCRILIDGEYPLDGGVELLPSEQKVVDKLHADGGDTSLAVWAFAAVLDACTLPPRDDWVGARTGATSGRRLPQFLLWKCAPKPHLLTI